MMASEKVKSLLLIACVVFSLFVSAWLVQRISGPGSPPARDIHVYVVDAGDAVDCWVGNTSAVKKGIEAAINDAATKTKVKWANENFNNTTITTSTELESLLTSSPERAVVVNTHGEPVPIPNRYFSPYIHITSPIEGATLKGDVTVEATVKTLSGVQLDGLPYATCSGPGCTGTEPYPMTLVDPTNGTYRVSIDLTWSGTYVVRAYAQSDYSLLACEYVRIKYDGVPWPWESLPSTGIGGHDIHICPYVHVWTGQGFEEDNNLLLGHGDSTVDHYLLEKNLVENASGEYLVRLSESGDKRDFFDCVRLLAVDHLESVNVGVDSNGMLFTYGNPHPADCACLMGNQDLRLPLMQPDDPLVFVIDDGNWLDLRWNSVNASMGAKVVLRLRSENEDPVDVQCLNGSGLWETVACVMPRALWMTHVLNVSGWLPDFEGECRLRLSFNKRCVVDYVGLDTAEEASVSVHEGELVSVLDSSGVNATFGDLREADGVCAQLTHGYTHDLRFRLPELNGSDLERDFIFVAEGYYVEKAEQMPAQLGWTKQGVLYIDWKDWFEWIENLCRTKGWIWANVAGYSFFYAGNSEYWSMMGAGYIPYYDEAQPLTEGLKQFLNKDVTCNCSCDGHIAELGFDYSERSGFWDTYLGFDGHRNVSAWRPIDKNAAIPWSMFFYKDKTDDSWSTATIAMNKTELGSVCQPGTFVHNGFSEDPDMDNLTNTFDDDWLKGYVATALAIEEARTFITLPSIQQRESPIVGCTNHTACFGVTMRAADRGELYDTEVQDYYRYVRLLFTTTAYFPNAGAPLPPFYYDYFLSHLDIDLPEMPDMRYEIREDECGVDLGTGTQFMDDWHWYAVSTVAGFVPYVGVIAGPVLDALPLLIEHFQPTWKSDPGPQEHAWANGTWIDPNQDGRGTIDFFIEIRFYKGNGGIRTYTFNGIMASWEGLNIKLGPVNIVTLWREHGLQHTKQLTFSADWNI